ncbi:hypothetical protein [Candidatus Nitrosocosmicus sp. FF01]|jgi:predicted phosphoribosyltransferase|uniref:hypothetical protein n=1 Tax=Candidatus Nitrosocosmicus sp. FF01 TaxID=3397670 RepID=UPI0039EB14DA
MLSKVFSFARTLKHGTHIKFRDRETAALILTSVLKDKVKNIEDPKKQVLVLGIPRGGIIMAKKISEKLGCSFDFIVPLRLVAPNDHELSIGAVMSDSTITYLNMSLIEELGIEDSYLNKEKEKKLKEINEKTRKYLSSQNNKKYNNNYINDVNSTGMLEENGGYLLKYSNRCKLVILIDDGVFSGASIIVAARWIIKNLSPPKVIVSSPIIPKEIIPTIKHETVKSIDVVSLISPSINRFKNVGNYYINYLPVNDDEVMKCLGKNNYG